MGIVKFAIVYWVIGCVLSGMSLGFSANDCPGDWHRLEIRDVVVFGIGWPAVVGYGMVRDISRSAPVICGTSK